MIAQPSQAAYSRTHLGLWDEYAHQAIVIHAGSAMAWWMFSLAKQPTSSLAAMCLLASSWLLVRQCSRLTSGNLWCLLVTAGIVCSLGWQAFSDKTAPAAWDTIFAWWVLSVLLIACELNSVIVRRNRSQLYLGLNTMDAPTPNDPQLSLATATNIEQAGQDGTAQSPPELGSSATIAKNAASLPASNAGMKWAFLLIALFLFVYMVIVPTIGYIFDQLTPPKSGHVLEDMTFSEKIRLHSVSGVVMLTFLALGGTIGSFLNVFIYRVPRRMPLLWPPSSCASCRTRIHGKDNVPVLGWILISGRCRSCAHPISARYPVIESIVALVFVALYYVELLSGGDNIPIRTPNLYRGIVWVLLYTKWDLLGMYIYHCLMLSLLLSVAMMNVDGFRLPWKHAVMLLIAFATASLAIPALHPVPAPYVPAFMTCLVGAALGVAVGLLMQLVLPVLRRPKAARVSDEPEINSAGFELTVNKMHCLDSPVAGSSVDRENIPSEFDQKSSHTQLPIMGDTKVADSDTRYGESAMAPAIYTDAAFGMILIGIVLGPQAVISVAALMIPFVVAFYCSRAIRKIPITLALFAIACLHQLFWVQIHRLLTFSWLNSD